jgi:type II secretory pathway component PulK
MNARRERGAALLLVILLVALLAILVVEFQREARVELRAARSVRDDIQAHALVRSGSAVAANVLAIYGSQSLADLNSAITAVPGGQMVWDLFFGDKEVPIPVPEGVEGDVTLTVRLGDLHGAFPLGALYDPQGAGKPRQDAFKDYLASVREYLADREVQALENVDTDSLAQAVVDRLTNPSDPKMPIAHLSELRQVDGFTSEVLKAVAPFLDTRTEWEFNANRLSVPMLMTMKHISLEDAQTLADDLRENPILEEAALPNDARFQGRDAQLFQIPANLKTKSRGFNVFLEAEIQGVKRRAKAVLRRPLNPPPELGNRFVLEEWEEGWVEDWPERPREPKGAEAVGGNP